MLAPGLDQLPPPAALPDLRRHRPARRGRQRDRRHARRRLVPRPPRLRRQAGRSTATAPAPSSQLEVEHPDGTPHGRHHRRLVALDARPGDPRRHLQRRDVRRSAASCPAGRRPASTTPTGRRWRSGRSTSRRSSPRPARRCAAPRRCPSLEITTSPSGKTLVDFGQNLVGRLRFAAARRAGRHRDHRCGTPRCSSTASWAPGRCARPTQTDVVVLDGNGPRDLGAAVHLPRLPLRRGERLAGRADAGRPRGRRRPHRPAPRPARSPARTRTSNRLHENVVWGMRGNFVDVPDRLPAARRAAGLDRRPRRSSRRPRPSSTTPPACSASWLADLAVEQLEDHDGVVPIFVPFPDHAAGFPRCRRTPAGATPPSSSRGCCTSARRRRAARRPVGRA